MAQCDQCGREIPAGDSFCQSCGKSVENNTVERTPAQPEGIFWSNRMGVITSTVVIKQLIMALGGGFLFVAIILIIADPASASALLMKKPVP